MPISIKDVVNAAAGAAVQPGQVVQFKEGQVPEGYAQISGSSKFPVGGGAFLSHNLSATAPNRAGFMWVAGNNILTEYGKESSSRWFSVINENLETVGAESLIPLSYGNGNLNLVALADGNMLRIGGSAGLSSPTTTHVQRFNPSTGAFTTLLARPAAIGSGYLYMQAGDGKVYGFGTTSGAGTSVECYDYPSNTWNTAWGTRPSFTPVAAAKLPSGKIFVVSNASAQYIFDPSKSTQAEQWTQVGYEAISYAGIITTDTGVRLYATYSGANVNSFIDYNESTGQFLRSDTKASFTSARAVKTPAGKIHVQTSPATILTHYLDYTPATTVDAVKL